MTSEVRITYIAITYETMEGGHCTLDSLDNKLWSPINVKMELFLLDSVAAFPAADEIIC